MARATRDHPGTMSTRTVAVGPSALNGVLTVEIWKVIVPEIALRLDNSPAKFPGLMMILLGLLLSNAQVPVAGRAVFRMPSPVAWKVLSARKVSRIVVMSIPGTAAPNNANGKLLILTLEARQVRTKLVWAVSNGFSLSVLEQPWAKRRNVTSKVDLSNCFIGYFMLMTTAI